MLQKLKTNLHRCKIRLKELEEFAADRVWHAHTPANVEEAQRQKTAPR